MKFQNFALILLAFCFFMGAAVDGHAHSRKGLVKITLESDNLTPDQLAYYLELKVNQRLDEKGRKNRFFLLDFEKIEMKGDMALVHGEIFDQKTGATTPEILYMSKNSDSTWNHVEADGTMITERIYTMIEPDYSIYYISGGIAALLALLGGMIFVRKRKAKKS